MDKATRALLSADEADLVRRSDKARLDKLDEDALVELHTRVRRARTKYAKLHRRQAGAQVRSDRARGAAAPKNQRTLAKAEVFEDALARVSTALAAAARRSAADLKAERLAAARVERAGAAAGASRPTRPTRRAGKPAGSSRPSGATKAKAPRRTPISKRASATARATGRRGQAKRDSR